MYICYGKCGKTVNGGINRLIPAFTNLVVNAGIYRLIPAFTNVVVNAAIYQQDGGKCPPYGMEGYYHV